MAKLVVTCGASSIRGINNFGDELLALIYGAWIREFDSSLVVHHLSVPQHGFLNAEESGAIDTAQCLVFTGGGYFADGDTESRHWTRRHLRALRNRRVYWPVFQRAALQGKPIAVLGLEVGPLANLPFRSVVRAILRGARTVVVRNEESREFALRLVGAQRGILMHMDAALATTEVAFAEGGVPVKSEDSQKIRIGLHLHSLEGPAVWQQYQKLIGALVSLAQQKSGARLIYLHDQRKGGRHPVRSERAAERIADSYPDVDVIPYVDPLETVAAINDLDLLVTAKLHMGIVGRSLGVPVLATGRHPKIRRFYESIEEGSSCLHDPKSEHGGLPGSVEGLFTGVGPRRSAVGPVYRESALGNRAALHAFLEGNI